MAETSEVSQQDLYVLDQLTILGEKSGTTQREKLNFIQYAVSNKLALPRYEADAKNYGLDAKKLRAHVLNSGGSNLESNIQARTVTTRSWRDHT